MRLEPNPANPCFGCGGANSRGMRLVFEQDDENKLIRGHFRIPAEYQGSGGWVHGGIIALVLDEAMGKLNRFRQVHAVTAELQVEYLRPIRVEQDLVVEAFEVEKVGRNLHHECEIRNTAGQVLARGQGRFVEVDPARYKP
jgi:uncharacterized protein (TIGR00369 family)